ncbi:hypothetical protein PC113_g5199 [Phytophthora cactorum]|uniref:Uncharacterized protein n=1 Tax=Phytophthora cactorum TaxID=29920 RepID=A0A8T0ZNX3_9STRA|nr:hypothetical protein PC111_g4113 [Phytophthora cactorum]KAG2863719.1 hypothetical protein PC113_g5199 [Phytophthora cactorum]
MCDQEQELADASATNAIGVEPPALVIGAALQPRGCRHQRYIWSIQGGSTRGSTYRGSPPADQDSAPPDQASRDLAQARSEVTWLSHDLRVARESIATLTTERDQAQHDRSNVTAECNRLQLQISDLEVERDNAITEWDVATRKQTEVKSSIRDLSDKLKTARDAADTLSRQVSESKVVTINWPPIMIGHFASATKPFVAAASGSLDQASSGHAIPTTSSPDHGSGSSASTSTPAPASKSASSGPRSPGGGAAQTPAKRPRSGSTSSDTRSFRTRKQPRAPPAEVGQGTETVDLPMREIYDDGGASVEIDDDGGVSGSGNRGSTGKTSAGYKVKQPSPHGFGFSSSDEDDAGDEGDDDLEDSEEAEIADMLLEEDTIHPLSLSLNRDRRPVADPTPLPLVILPVDLGGLPVGRAIQITTILGQVRQDLELDSRIRGIGQPSRPIAPSSSGGAQGTYTSRSATVVSKSAPTPDLLPENPFGPDSDFVPGRLQPRQLDVTAIAPWAAEKLNQVVIVAMTIGILFPDLPLKTSWIFPHEGGDVPLTDYHDDLVTQPQIESLMAAKPWEILSTNSVLTISFQTNVGGWIGLFLGAYRQFETKLPMTLWEETHKFPIPRPKIAKSAWLADFKKKRGNRRSHAGAD